MEENSAESNAKSNFKCTFCEKTFTRKFSVKRHMKIVHGPAYSTFKEREILKGGGIFKEFIDFNEFLIWKEQHERETTSMYVRQRGNSIRKNGDKILHYYCNRSGVYKPKGKGLRRLKSKGSAKIGASCPARMRVKITSENVIVHFFQKHENHELDVEHLKLPQSKRETIAQIDFKLADNSHNDTEIEIAEPLDDDLNQTLDVHPKISQSKNYVNSSVKTKLESIMSYLDECKFSPQENESIHKSLNKVLDICRSNVEKQKHNIQLKENSTINIRKKIKKQNGYFSTKKRPTTNSRVSNITIMQAQNIKENLLSNNEVIYFSTNFDHSYSYKC